MTMSEILNDAQGVIVLAQGIGAADPRLALALQVLASSVTLVQSLHAQGRFDPYQTIEVNDIGVALLENLRKQLAELSAP